MRYLRPFIYCLILTITVSACSWSSPESSDGGSESTSTLVGNPATFQVDTSKMTLGAVTNTQSAIKAADGFLTLGSGYTFGDITFVIKRNNTAIRVLTSHDFFATTNTLFSLNIPGTSGDQIGVDVYAENAKTADTVSLAATLSLSAITPNALSTSPSEVNNAATQISNFFCERIVACYPNATTLTACKTAIGFDQNGAQYYNQTLYADMPGEEDWEETYFFNELSEGIENGSVTTNTTVLSACMARLAEIPCDDPNEDELKFSRFYDPANPNYFGDLPSIATSLEPETCEGVFTGLPKTTRVVNQFSRIADSICNRIQGTRYDMTLNTTLPECNNAVRLLTNLGPKLGLGNTAYANATLETIIRAVESGTLKTSERAVNDCQSNIYEAMKGEDEETGEQKPGVEEFAPLDAVYNPNDLNNYSGIATLVDCPDIFK